LQIKKSLENELTNVRPNMKTISNAQFNYPIYRTDFAEKLFEGTNFFPKSDTNNDTTNSFKNYLNNLNCLVLKLMFIGKTDPNYKINQELSLTIGPCPYILLSRYNDYGFNLKVIH
jgi:hypothetical protein